MTARRECIAGPRNFLSTGEVRITSRFRRILALGLLAVAVAGCSGAPATFGPAATQLAERTPYVAVPVEQAWVNADNIVTVLQRRLGNESEQKIGLSNRTTVRGDNMIFARTRVGPRGLRFEEIVAQSGGLPHPFTQASAGQLMQDDDGFGSYFWMSEQIGDSTTCVLGIRRLQAGMRQLPPGSSGMDVLLRNCVIGSAQDALAPLLATSVGSVPVARTRDGESRMLSPLAAPSAGL